MDRLRVQEFAKRVAAGEDPLEAFWRVASDPGVGYARLRGATQRPPEVMLRKKLQSLVERAAPDVAAAARGVALVQLSGMGGEATRAVQEVLNGECTEAQGARTRLEAARIVLGSIGVPERAAPPNLQAVQVNVEAPHSREDDNPPFIFTQPDLIAEFDQLAAKVEARERERAGGGGEPREDVGTEDAGELRPDVAESPRE
jgi:hypothetical protein